MDPEPGPPGSRRLSTGHVVTYPLEVEATIGGVILPARRSALEAVLPADLEPVPLGPGIGAVVLAGVSYHHVGVEGIDPYDEFAVIVPTLDGGWPSLRHLPALANRLGGYVHWLPVTSEASVALGRECWGYPKELATISVTDGPRSIRTTLETAQGTCHLEAPRSRLGRTPRREWALTSYTDAGDRRQAADTVLAGGIAHTPAVEASASWPSTLEPLARLEMWPRPLVAITGSRVTGRIHQGRFAR